MKWFAGIKRKIGYFVLKRKVQSVKRKKQTHNLYTAKTVGILFDATDDSNFREIRNLFTSLSQRGIRTFGLGYIDAKEISINYVAVHGFHFICKKDLTWYGLPNSPTSNVFINREYDILIDLNINNCLPLDFITGMTKASFRVGVFGKNDKLYDFMIDISKNNRIVYLIEQIKYYLTLLNN
ncbi:MAG: hypothetical protein C0594_14170 [Marinilabiliales bacterium]|nr:MAG: hypothetical protein C0594_14170 [Marinilabiliales bacterium]